MLKQELRTASLGAEMVHPLGSYAQEKCNNREEGGWERTSCPVLELNPCGTLTPGRGFVAYFMSQGVAWAWGKIHC